MDKTQLIKKIKSTVLQIDQGADIILYGSRARGDYRFDSDWDFLILTNLPENNSTK